MPFSQLSRFCWAIASLVLIVLSTTAFAQSADQSDGSADADVVERAKNSVKLLRPLLELESNLKDQISALNETATEGEDEAAMAELEHLQNELAVVREQMSVAVTGVSEQSYQALGSDDFDLNSEVQNLIEPFVLLLIEATSDARQLERTRRDLDVANRRLGDAETAISNAEAALAQVSDVTISERLEEALKVWRERLELHQTQFDALTQSVQDLQDDRVNVGRNVNDAFQVFFRDRSISLGLGLGAFLSVLILGRVLLFISQKIDARRRKEKSFAARLGGVLFSVFTVIASFSAMLFIFNLRNDWLLLGLATLLMIAAAWVTIKMLPNLIEQLWVILNLGAVQENERVLFNGVPFRVERLSFFTDLVNPALDGGEFTLPVRELVGMHSRPAACDEAWFPSEKGDWVKLSDGNAGRVIAQTPEMVVVELLGGAQVTYQTADYLAANPENLSNGYRVEIEFGIGYRHQPNAATTIVVQMTDGIAQHFGGLLEPSELVNIDVEFLRAGASSLDYEVEIDVAGSSAHRFEELERELARCMLLLANIHGWEIPFQQIVIHNPVPEMA